MTDAEMIKKLKLLARADIYGGTGSLAFLLEIAERLEELTVAVRLLEYNMKEKEQYE